MKMNKLVKLVVAVSLMTAGSAYADACSAKLTGVFTSFQATKACQTFGGSGSLIPSVDNTYDLGSASLGFRIAYIDSNVFTPDVRSGSATGSLAILGGAANSSAAGSRVLTEGVSAAGQGDLTLSSSSGADADIFADLNAANSDFLVRNLGGSTLLTVAQSGAVQATSTIRSSATADIGWSVVNVANQACNTTCTSACVVGIDTLGTGGFLGCAVATADSCICAGAS